MVPVLESGTQHAFDGVQVPVQQSSSVEHAAVAPRQQSPLVQGPEQQSSSKVHCPFGGIQAHCMSGPQACEQQSLAIEQLLPTVEQHGASSPWDSE